MTKAQMQSLAHELTMEYLRVHTDILAGNLDSIDNAVDTFADIYSKFYNALANNRKFDKLYL